MYLVDNDGSSNEDGTFKKSVEKGQKYMVVDLGGKHLLLVLVHDMV